MKRNRKTISNTFPHYRSQQVSLLGLDLVSIMQRNCRVVLNLAENRNRTKMALDEKMALDAVLFDANQQSKNMQIDFRAPRRCRSIGTKVYSIVLLPYFNMKNA